jgi:hypothetical protein
MVGTFVLFPMCDQHRNKVLYNIKARTHPLLEYTIILKLLWMWALVLFNSYCAASNLSWYFWPFLYGFYLFTLGPSLLHSLYFITTFQRQLKELPLFTELSITLKCIIMCTIFLSAPIIVILSIFFVKGIFLYFALSLAMVLQFISACARKKYTFTHVLLYDMLLTACLTVLGMFLPALNFSPLTIKDLIIFWNYYLGLFIFGIIISRKQIKLEMA